MDSGRDGFGEARVSVQRTACTILGALLIMAWFKGQGWWMWLGLVPGAILGYLFARLVEAAFVSLACAIFGLGAEVRKPTKMQREEDLRAAAMQKGDRGQD